MERPRVMIVYATTHGHTEKIVARVARVLTSSGCSPTRYPVDEVGHARPSDFDAVVIAGSVHMKRHQKTLVDWVAEHVGELRDRPTGFISVSLTAAENDDGAARAIEEMIELFTTDTGWEPDWTLPVAGALQYRQYDAFTRTLMKLMMKAGDHPTDTSRDYVYTDWDSLDQFVEDVAEGIKARLAPDLT